VGVVAIGGRLIEVVPKIDRQNEMEARENLHLMIAAAGLVPASRADVARLAQKNKPLIAAYMWLYMERLAEVDPEIRTRG